MPFNPVTYNTGAAPGLDGPAFNAMQLQYAEAIISIPQGVLTPYVESGLTAARDGTTLSQLNVAAGVAWPKQTNNTLQRRAPSISTQSTSGHPSTTMYLFLNPDGTWAWQTSSTPPTNALAVAHCTTDASSNILTVTDDRVLGTTLLAGMGTQAITLPGGMIFGAVAGGLFSTPSGTSALFSIATSTILTSPLNGGALTGVAFRTWTGSAVAAPFSVGGQFNGALAWVDNSGGMHFDNNTIASDGSGNLTAGTSINSPAIVAQSGTGVKFAGSRADPASDTTVRLQRSSTANTLDVVMDASGVRFIKNSGSSYTSLVSIDGSGNLSGPIGGGIPTTRNGAALSVPIYTGSSTPVNPPTGSLWFSA